MSYRLSLYCSNFLRRASEAKECDWPSADRFSEEVLRGIECGAVAAGFTEVVPERLQNWEGPGRLFEIAAEELMGFLAISSSKAEFSVPFTPLAESSVEFCLELARALARKYALGLYDEHIGAAEYFDAGESE